jgi:hypothetical protein
VRREKERLLTEQEVAQLEAEYVSAHAAEQLTTTAPEGASIEVVQAGVREVQAAREAAAAGTGESDDVTDAPPPPKTNTPPIPTKDGEGDNTQKNL